MDSPTPIILKVATPNYKRIIIDASNGKRYHADLSSFSNVYCFPKSEAEWKTVTPDSDGFGLIWSSRFEVHIDQVIALADRIDDSYQSA